MKLLVLTAIIAAVASSPLIENSKWPWHVGKEYVYDVDSYTWTRFESSNSNGNAFKTQFVVRVKAPGQLLAKLENPLYAQIQDQQVDFQQVPADLKYTPVEKFGESFEIFVDGGRVLSVKVSSSLSVSDENLLKGLLSALQVDLSSSGQIHSFPNSFDKETFQGLFKKTEVDVSGDCETLYSVSPISSEWRRELPDVTEEPIEITKSKNYRSCNKHATYAIGLPEGAVWHGIADQNEQKQLIKHTSESRILAGKQGTIYRSKTITSVSANPLLFGKQQTEVYSYIQFQLKSVGVESATEWNTPKESRKVDSLLFTFDESTYIQADAQTIPNAQKLLQEVSPLLLNPSNLADTDFLSKFNVLVRLIASMNSEQLSLMTSSTEVTKSSKNVDKNKMWEVYRDAVAQAGTIAAFKEIKSWILTKKIEGEEAAEVIGSLPSSLRYYTKGIANEFFDLAFSPEVTEQKFLNTSALLAVTKYLRLSKEDLFVVEKVIPRFSQELKQAIEKGDNSKAQVYIRSLGNLAHEDILKVFAPYFEGQVTVTKYLRIQIVISLKTLANLKNDKVRAVLFSILRNTGEPYEVRVAAALNIFLSFPDAEMLQIMAHMTNNDPSTQVRAVLANGISFAAGLKDPRFEKLSKDAKAVLSIVTKEKVGFHASTESIIDEYTSSDDIAHFRELSYIGSENSFFPVYHRSALRLRGNGRTEEDWLTMSVSDVKYLFDYVANLIIASDDTVPDFKFSAKKIVEALKIKRQAQDPLEGALFVDILDQQKLFTFSEKEFEGFVLGLFQQFQKFGTDFETHFTKVITNKQVFVTFPVATGMPFILAYNEPTAFIVKIKANAKIASDMIPEVNVDIQFTYARNLEGSVGFLDTVGEVYASAGVVNELQFYIPLNLTYKPSSKNIAIKVKLPEQDAKFVSLNVAPYTTLQKKNSPLTVLKDPATKVINRDSPVLISLVSSSEYTFYEVGLQLEAYSESSDFKGDFLGADLLTNIRNLLYQKDIATTIFALKYKAKRTESKEVTFTAHYETLYNHKQGGEMGRASYYIFSDTDTADTRRKEIVKRASSGIDSAKVELIDFSAQFGGEPKVEYVLTAALANSVVDNKVQAAIFASGHEQFNAVFKMVKPKIVPLNFEEALKNDIEVKYEADFLFGDSEIFHFQGSGERSDEYTKQLLNDPLAKTCLQETSQNNFYQKDCYQMIMKAHAPDSFKATVTYEGLSSLGLAITNNFFKIYKHFYNWEEEQDVLTTIEDGKIEIQAKAYYYENYIDYEFVSKYGVYRLKNVEGLSYFPYAMAIYAPVTNWERSYNIYTGYQYLPYCAVDDNKVWTFSGRSYDYSLTSSWHVVMVDEFQGLGNWNDLVILARRPSNKQEEVYISYRHATGLYVEVEIKPTEVNVKTNTRKIVEGDHTIYLENKLGVSFLEYYNLADGVKAFSIDNGAIRVLYDGQRLVVFTDKHRKSTRGICGQSTTQTSDDYMTPYGLVDQPELYGASFSLEGEFSDPKTVELKKQAQLKAYQPVTKYTNILRSDVEWSKAENESVKGL